MMCVGGGVGGDIILKDTNRRWATDVLSLGDRRIVVGPLLGCWFNSMSYGLLTHPQLTNVPNHHTSTFIIDIPFQVFVVHHDNVYPSSPENKDLSN